MRFLNQHWPTVRSSAESRSGAKSFDRCGAVQSFGAAPSAAAVARPRQSWWQGARTVPLRAMGALVTTGKPAAAAACVCAWECHALTSHIGAVASRLAGVRTGCCWAHLAEAWCASHLAAWFTMACDWLQLVSRRPRLCGARTGSPISTSFTACIHRGERGRLCGLPGDPGARCRRPDRSEMDRACTVGDAVAPGWSRANLVDATVRG